MLGLTGLEQLVEDMVGSLDLLLLSDPGLLKKIRHNVTTSKFSGRCEMDSDEFSKSRGIVIS